MDWLRDSGKVFSLAVLGLSGATFALHYIHLSATPFANGWDGYYYLVQVKAWVEEGAMHSRDTSPVYALMRGVYHLCGDYVQAYKLTAAMLAAAFTAVSCLAARALSGRPLLGIATGLWTLGSPTLLYFAAGFPKNLLGMDLLVLGLYLGLRQRPLRMWIALVLAALSHRMTAALAFILLLGRKLKARTALALLLAGAAGVALLALLPGGLRPADLARFEGTLVRQPQLAPVSFPEMMGSEAFPRTWRLEMWLALGAILLLAVLHLGGKLPEESRKWRPALLLLMAILWFPFLKMDALGMGYRFFLAGLLLAPICMAAALAHWNKAWLIIPLLAIGLLGPQGAFDATEFGPPHAEYNYLSERIGHFFEEKQPELLIGHKGLAEQVTFETGIDVLPWQPEYEVDSLKLWRISADIFRLDYKTYLSPQDFAEVYELPPYHAILRETVWQRFVAAAQAAQDEELLGRIYDWVNPHEQRPAYLLGRK